VPAPGYTRPSVLFHAESRLKGYLWWHPRVRSLLITGMVNIAHQLVGLLQRIIYRGKAGETCPAEAAEKNILDADFHG
jgi:hypothetical protein